MESILDRSNSYLKIFTSKVEIDKNLPKWKIINDKNNSEDKNITIDKFLEFDSSEFNIYLNKKIVDNIFNNSISDISWNKTNIEYEYKNLEKSPTIIQKISKLFRKKLNSNETEVEEVYQLNIFQFFDNVKGLLKDSVKTYVNRIEPYILAMKQAQDMGQIALVDKLAETIFINKYESILYAAGFYQKITEEQLVDFVKKSEKGIQLCYVKNFIRPIPENVIKTKQEADKLLVFDNYCILYYDKDTKSFSKTKAEKEAERRKKADPILFGMIYGSKNLYYIADWIDEYCDLTIDEFLKVSGLSEKEISISEKIKL